MEKLLGNITLGTIFRHFLSGAVFIAFACHAKSNGASAGASKLLEKPAGLLTLAALICGAFIYSVHRALSNPGFESLRHKIMDRHEKLCQFVMPDYVVRRMRKRWKLAEDDEHACKKTIFRRFSRKSAG
jgi:hypothetical protein